MEIKLKIQKIDKKRKECVLTLNELYLSHKKGKYNEEEYQKKYDNIYLMIKGYQKILSKLYKEYHFSLLK